MAIDLLKLPKELKEGKVTGEGTRMMLTTPLARASFLSLAEEETYLGEPTGRHSLTMLFETAAGVPGAVDLKAGFVPFFEKVLTAYKIKPRFEDGACIVGDQRLFRKGEKFSREGKAYQGYTPSTVYLKANSKIRTLADKVPCFNAAGEEIDPGVIYSGCYVRANIGLYKPEKFPKLSITLKSVQFVLDGDRFSGDGLVSMDGIEGAEPAATAGDFSSFV